MSEKPKKERMKYGLKKYLEKNKLSNKELYCIADKNGLNPKEADIYVKFMKKRFPYEFDKEYAGTWARRIQGGECLSYDSDSSKIARSIKGFKCNKPKTE